MDGERSSDSQGKDAPPRVLVVEDNAFISLDIETQLADLGCEVVGIATTAATAIEMARQTMPDVAIVDLKLADGSRGQDAAAVFRQELGIPSIILSGSLHSMTDEERETIRPIAMLSKPVFPHQLQRAVGL